MRTIMDLCLYSLSGTTFYRMIWWSLEAARYCVRLFQSLRNLAGIWAAALAAAKMPVKFQSDAMIMTSNLAASRPQDILQ